MSASTVSVCRRQWVPTPSGADEDSCRPTGETVQRIDGTYAVSVFQFVVGNSRAFDGNPTPEKHLDDPIPNGLGHQQIGSPDPSKLLARV